MNKNKQIQDKTLKVINSCTKIKHLDMLYNYFDLAKKRITKYKYIEPIEIALHNKTEGIVEIARYDREKEVEKRIQEKPKTCYNITINLY